MGLVAERISDKLWTVVYSLDISAISNKSDDLGKDLCACVQTGALSSVLVSVNCLATSDSRFISPWCRQLGWPRCISSLYDLSCLYS
jgi:hypothetical protein